MGKCKDGYKTIKKIDIVGTRGKAFGFNDKELYRFVLLVINMLAQAISTYPPINQQEHLEFFKKDKLNLWVFALFSFHSSIYPPKRNCPQN